MFGGVYRRLYSVGDYIMKMRRCQAMELARYYQRLENIEITMDNSEQALSFIEDVFNPPRNLIKDDEELVAFSKELYKQICEYCGKDGISFMGIA